MPQPILGPKGYLPLKQKNLETLHLVSDGWCSAQRLHLEPFTKLKNLSWTGLRSRREMAALRDCFKVSSHQLVQLHLDFLEWVLIRPDGRDSIQQMLLGTTRCAGGYMFPTLKHLSLAGYSFERVSKQLATAFNWGSMQSLSIRFCQDWEAFLKDILSLKKEINIRSLQVQYSPKRNPGGGDGSPAIESFLNAFEGLEELFIATNDATRTDVIWEAITHHKSTLKSLVYHQRYRNRERTMGLNFLGDRDLHVLISLPKEINKDSSLNPLSQLDLEFLGICCTINNLVGLIAVIHFH